jgi:hypothetical protein
LHPNFHPAGNDDLLGDAADIMKQRGSEYGPPSDHHARTAQAVNAILGTDLTPRDVALFFVVDKLVRARTSPGKRDHYLDCAAYISIAWDHQRDR